MCMYVRLYTYVYGCELTIGMYARICIYVNVHIRAETYLCGWPYVFCTGTTNPTQVYVEMV